MPKIVGLGVCGPGEADRYLEATLKEFDRLCDETLIVTNNAGKKEKDLIDSFGFCRYEDDRDWGRNQRLLKEGLHGKAGDLGPDWVLALDMDERFGSLAPGDLERLAAYEKDAWHFFMVDLWDDGYRPDLCFWKVQFYRYRREKGVAFSRWGFDPGLVPEWAATSAGYSPYHILHYGLKDARERQRRVARYKHYDPDAKGLPQAYYEALAGEEKAAPLDEEKLQELLYQEFITYKRDAKVSLRQK